MYYIYVYILSCRLSKLSGMLQLGTSSSKAMASQSSGPRAQALRMAWAFATPDIAIRERVDVDVHPVSTARDLPAKKKSRAIALKEKTETRAGLSKLRRAHGIEHDRKHWRRVIFPSCCTTALFHMPALWAGHLARDSRSTSPSLGGGKYPSDAKPTYAQRKTPALG